MPVPEFILIRENVSTAYDKVIQLFKSGSGNIEDHANFYFVLETHTYILLPHRRNYIVRVSEAVLGLILSSSVVIRELVLKQQKWKLGRQVLY